MTPSMRPWSRLATSSIPWDFTNWEVLTIVAKTDFSMFCQVLSLDEEAWTTMWLTESLRNNRPGMSSSANSNDASLEHHIPNHVQKKHHSKQFWERVLETNVNIYNLHTYPICSTSCSLSSRNRGESEGCSNAKQFETCEMECQWEHGWKTLQ